MCKEASGSGWVLIFASGNWDHSRSLYSYTALKLGLSAVLKDWDCVLRLLSITYLQHNLTWRVKKNSECTILSWSTLKKKTNTKSIFTFNIWGFGRETILNTTFARGLAQRYKYLLGTHQVASSIPGTKKKKERNYITLVLFWPKKPMLRGTQVTVKGRTKSLLGKNTQRLGLKLLCDRSNLQLYSVPPGGLWKTTLTTENGYFGASNTASWWVLLNMLRKNGTFGEALQAFSMLGWNRVPAMTWEQEMLRRGPGKGSKGLVTTCKTPRRQHRTFSSISAPRNGYVWGKGCINHPDLSTACGLFTTHVHTHTPVNLQLDCWD